jgi:hypothetical protein
MKFKCCKSYVFLSENSGIVNRDATNEFLGVSPIQTTLHFKLPTQVSLPDFSSYEQFPVEPLKGNDITSGSYYLLN